MYGLLLCKEGEREQQTGPTIRKSLEPLSVYFRLAGSWVPMPCWPTRSTPHPNPYCLPCLCRAGNQSIKIDVAGLGLKIGPSRIVI